jgi:hypothetical protein
LGCELVSHFGGSRFQYDRYLVAPIVRNRRLNDAQSVRDGGVTAVEAALHVDVLKCYQKCGICYN